MKLKSEIWELTLVAPAWLGHYHDKRCLWTEVLPCGLLAGTVKARAHISLLALLSIPLFKIIKNTAPCSSQTTSSGAFV